MKKFTVDIAAAVISAVMQKVNSAFHLSGVGKSSTGLYGWG